MSEEARYIDADVLRNLLHGCLPYVPVPYSTDQLSSAINNQISNMISDSLNRLLSNLEVAIMTSSKPYSQCMLCTRRDCDSIPPHPLGEGYR